MNASYWLPIASVGVVAGAVALYVILDGFDLGLGILFPFFRTEAERDHLMNTVAPFWDGNETWLVFGGVGLFVAFPVAYAVILPALYIPAVALLLALVFRGVAFEFRWVAKPYHGKWDVAFAVGSTVATFCQGVMLGGLMKGIRVNDGQFAGGPFDWLTPFSLMCGLGLIVGYTLLGCCWLIMKSSGGIERKAREVAPLLLLGMLGLIVLISVWTPLEFPRIAARWFVYPHWLYLSPVPFLTAVLAVVCWRGMRGTHAAAAFWGAVGLFVLSFAGLAISTLPYIVPFSLDVWRASSAPASQEFFLIGAAMLLPFILGYTVFVYRTFRGKLEEGGGYH